LHDIHLYGEMRRYESLHRYGNCRAAAELRQAPRRTGRRRKRSAGSPL